MELQRATIRRFDAATWQADVELVGAHTALLSGVPVATSLGAALVAPGSQVWVCLSAEGNPADAAIVAPWGAPPGPWVSSRLWRPTLVSAERTDPLTCSSATFAEVPGLAVTLAVEVESMVLLGLVATVHLETAGCSYGLAFHHDDGHEATALTPAAALGGPGAAAGERRPLAWLALQTAIAPGEHTFRLKHRVADGEAVLEAARVVALVAAA